MIEQEKKTLICLILEALKKQGSWCGETHIQKAAYLAKEMFKIPLEEYDFFLYRYGPYSSEISVDLATMRNEEIIVRTATYPFGATYGVKENKEIPSEDMEECRKQYGKKIDFIAEKSVIKVSVIWKDYALHIGLFAIILIKPPMNWRKL